MAIRTFRTRILRFVIGFLLIFALALMTVVSVSTNHHVANQLERELLVSESVVQQQLKARQQVLFKAAKILTADFGFKQAVASQDEATAASVLTNHGGRIDADIMALAHLSGKIYASNFEINAPQNDLKGLFNAIEETNDKIQLITFGEKIYQVILLPIKAPIPIAFTLIGFEVNSSLLNEFKSLVILDITVESDSNDNIVVSTFQDTNIKKIKKSLWDKRSNLTIPLFSRPEYISTFFTIDQLDKAQSKIYLTVSADAAFSTFDSLRREILLISLTLIFLALIKTVFTTRNLVKPLIELADFTQRIARGEFRIIVPKNHNIKEVMLLANSFEQMQIDLAEREARIVYQAHHDPLTKLINRQHIITLLDETLKNSTSKFAVICINIMNFRLVNDSFGHFVGDQCLQQIGSRLQNLPLEEYSAARLGGDEFLVACKLNKNVESVSSDILLSLTMPYQINSLEITLSFCMGLSVSPRDGNTADSLVQKANIALDMVRREQLVLAFYEPKMEAAHMRQLQLLTDLKATLKDSGNQLKLYFQPKINSRNPADIRFEALIRWIHPEQGFIPPDLFIPLAEQAGLIGSITDWVVKAALQQLAEWQTKGIKTQVAINLSAKDLSRKFLNNMVNEELATLNLASDNIAFEITESEIMRDPKEAIDLLMAFREQGFDLAIDDFGTGYSSLSQLKHIPVTDLKIDKSFVLQLANREDDQIIVQSTIALAHSFNLQVVAEGIEDIHSLEMLKSWGCDWLQGFFISKPIPAEDVLKWVTDYQAKLSTNDKNVDYNA